MTEQWLLWRDGVHDPWFNMSVDELLLEAAPELGMPLLRTYRWDRPALSIGCLQSFPAEQEARYAIVRRPTGGGNVFHDVDLTYTAVIPVGHRITSLDRMESYRIFHAAMLPMLDALGAHAGLQQKESANVDRRTMRCFTSPSRFDVVADDGTKYAGAAQRRTRNGILHQGSIQLAVSGGDWGKLEEELRKALKRHFRLEYTIWSPPEELLERAELLARAKYETTEWNRGTQS